MIQNIKASVPSFLHNGKRESKYQCLLVKAFFNLALWPFTMTPFTRVTAFGKGREKTLTVISVSISASWQAQSTMSLFACLLLVSGFCCCVAVQHQSGTDSLACLGGTVLGQAAGFIGTYCPNVIFYKLARSDTPLPDWEWVVGCWGLFKYYKDNLTECYVKEDSESVLTVVENEQHHHVQSTTQYGTRVKKSFYCLGQ